MTKDGKENIEFEKIPTLTEVLKLCMKLNMVIDLDVKPSGVQITNTLRDLLTTVPNAPNFMFVTSFYPHIIYNVKKECPEFVTGLLWGYKLVSHTITEVPRFPWYLLPFLEMIEKVYDILVHSFLLPKFLGVSAVVMQKNRLSKKYIDSWRNGGYEVIAWTVNHPTEKEFLSGNLNVPIITDSILDILIAPEQTC